LKLELQVIGSACILLPVAPGGASITESEIAHTYYRSAVESHKKRASFKSAYWKRHNSTGDRDQLNPAAALYDQDEKLILVTGNKKDALARSLARLL